MEINKDSDLMALHRAIVEAKFSEEPKDGPIPYSEILANLSNQIFDNIIKTLKEQNEPEQAEHWASIRGLDSEWVGFENIKKRIKETEVWIDLSEKEKVDLIKIICAPFQPNKEQVSELLVCNNET
ncbi:hypothetical protein [Shewanella japonica]|uniref:Uncharacterized protein n=1 Tax=Shewanella japonica TaxID=93973 RepID=A0ABM6JLA7_9GAMM|nr:hypothetical protein [Shewanella japonica]ARD22197.1 hypothetical protein SJ2017_1894 [Shewanella japonica]